MGQDLIVPLLYKYRTERWLLPRRTYNVHIKYEYRTGLIWGGCLEVIWKISFSPVFLSETTEQKEWIDLGVQGNHEGMLISTFSMFDSLTIARCFVALQKKRGYKRRYRVSWGFVKKRSSQSEEAAWGKVTKYLQKQVIGASVLGQSEKKVNFLMVKARDRPWRSLNIRSLMW